MALSPPVRNGRPQLAVKAFNPDDSSKTAGISAGSLLNQDLFFIVINALLSYDGRSGHRPEQPVGIRLTECRLSQSAAKILTSSHA
jgi:hypothetical protein